MSESDITRSLQILLQKNCYPCYTNDFSIISIFSGYRNVGTSTPRTGNTVKKTTHKGTRKTIGQIKPSCTVYLCMWEGGGEQERQSKLFNQTKRKACLQQLSKMKTK